MDSFTEIYEKQVGKVYRFLLRLSGNEQVAEELTQQTFFKAFLHMGSFKGNCSLYTWLCTIGKNEWFMECRKHKNLPLEILQEVDGGTSPEEELLSRSRQSIVRKAIWILSEPYREVVILRVYGELPFSEIGAHFHKTQGWAKVTFYRGKERLKKELEGKL